MLKRSGRQALMTRMGSVMPDKNVSAELVGGDSIAQFVVKQLLAGLVVKVTVDGRTYDGYVHNLDFATAMGEPDILPPDYVFALVRIPGLDSDRGGYGSVKVAIHTSGTVDIMPGSSEADQETSTVFKPASYDPDGIE